MQNKAAKELGRKGGLAKLKKYGRECFREMAKKRWKKCVQRQPTLGE